MPRRGDVEHTYRRYARELKLGVTEERARFLWQELQSLWWRMNESQRESVPDLAELRRGGSETHEGDEKAQSENWAPVGDSAEDELRRRWEAEVDARIAAARSGLTEPARVPAGQQATTEQEETSE